MVTYGAGPGDPRAKDDVHQLLRWLRGLPGRGVVLGQQLMSWGEPHYPYLVEQLTATTGRTPAMVGMGWHASWRNSNLPPVLRHAKRGGLVTFEMHPSDPWRDGGEETAWVSRGTGGRSDKTAKNDLRQLLTDAPESAAKAKWQRERAELATILEILDHAGVTVILRLFHELNGTWFWWGQDATTGRTAIVELYRDTWRYFTDTRQLHNLLWCYSPAPSWDGTVLAYYPGDQFADLIGPTRYDDTLRLLGPEIPGEENHDDWKALSQLGKPIGYGEFGPETDDGSWDARTVLDTIRRHYPTMCFALCWNGWEDENTVHRKELVAQRHIRDLLHHPLAITLENLDWNRS